MIYTTKSFNNKITALVDSGGSAVTVTMTADSKGTGSANFILLLVRLLRQQFQKEIFSYMLVLEQVRIH